MLCAPIPLEASPVNVWLVSWVMACHASVSARSAGECIVTHIIMLFIVIFITDAHYVLSLTYRRSSLIASFNNCERRLSIYMAILMIANACSRQATPPIIVCDRRGFQLRIVRWQRDPQVWRMCCTIVFRFVTRLAWLLACIYVCLVYLDNDVWQQLVFAGLKIGLYQWSSIAGVHIVELCGGVVTCPILYPQ